MINDVRNMKGIEILAELKKLRRAKRRKMARRLIYKKNQRPTERKEQIVLLNSLREEEALTDFDRAYALIAGAHKVCEDVDLEAASVWLGHLIQAEDSIRSMPLGFGLRKDRTHLVFSAINIALNLDLLTGSHHSRHLGNWFIEEIETLNPKRMTPYLFNSTSNIIKCAGLVSLVFPDSIVKIAPAMRLLVSYSIEINNPEHWWIYARLRAPSRIPELNERAAFGSHCRSVVRLLALEAAAKEADANARLKLLKEAANLCLAQATAQQHEALRRMIA